ncbi:hypothetical protein D3C86_1893130 [compost metagenome]
MEILVNRICMIIFFHSHFESVQARNKILGIRIVLGVISSNELVVPAVKLQDFVIDIVFC